MGTSDPADDGRAPFQRDDRPPAPTDSGAQPARRSTADWQVGTGTTIVGLTTPAAVVLAADRRASAGGGRFVTSKTMRKVKPVHSSAALAMAGAVSHLQQFVARLRAEASLYADRRGHEPSLTALSTLAGTMLRAEPLHASPIIGGVDGDGPQVFNVGGGGAVIDDAYAASGSGMQLAYGLLEREYDPSCSVADAVDLSAAAIACATDRDTATGNGLTVAVIDDEGVDITASDDPAEVGTDA